MQVIKRHSSSFTLVLWLQGPTWVMWILNR
jgi:hypothetical protein